MSAIHCVSCGKVGAHSDVHRSGFRLAPNLIGSYVCSEACDQVVIAAQEKAKKDRKAK